MFCSIFCLQRGFNFRSKLIMEQPNGDKLPDSVHILPNKAQVKGMHTVIRYVIREIVGG